jgi:uncharacterized membrane protein
MEQTWGERQQPRLAEHLEPILLPLALLFLIWDDVRILLITQSFALALGALPVFWIAYSTLTTPDPNPKSKIQNPKSTWPALVFAIVYLLSPHLQAANIADFHADPFIVTPLLFAFWYASQKRWRWMWFWAVIAMLTKENLPTLTAMLGLYLILDACRAKQANSHKPGNPSSNPQAPIPKLQSPSSNLPSVLWNAPILHGLALTLISAAWFFIATFLIVAPLARHYFGTDGPIYLAHRFSGAWTDLLRLFQEPARWQYLLGLFASVGFLPLLAPELLILGLPVLAANFLSNFPGQYSGEQHYSAPLVAAFILAAIHGAGRLVKKSSHYNFDGQSLKQIVLIAVCLWLGAWSLGYHALHGWTSLSIRTENYQMKPGALQLPIMLSQIPAEAIVSSSPAIHPHLAHRRINYLFPVVKEADYLLVDVTDISSVHPYDVRTQLLDLLNANWRILEANHGLIFAQKALLLPRAPIPHSFFDFARATTRPVYPTWLAFGGPHLYLSGYDVFDDPDDGLTFRFYWQATTRLSQDLNLWPLIYDDQGQLLSDPTQVPMIATVWYPPTAWFPGEVIVTETLPQLLPTTFHLGMAVGPSNSFSNPAQRLPVNTNSTARDIRLYPGRWVQLATFERQGPLLARLSPQPTLHSFSSVQAQFGSSIQLTGFWLDTAVSASPGSELLLILRWVANHPPQADLTVFIHLLAPDGRLVAQNDAWPTWLSPQPTSQWPLNQPILDRHTLTLPPDLPPATYTLQLGLYDAATLERLNLRDGQNVLQLMQIQVK